MAKDINIHLKTQGAERTKQQLEEVGRSAKQVGDKTAEGHREGAESVDKTTQKMTGMGRVLSNLKSAVLGFVGGFLGLQGVIRLVDYLQQKLQRIQQIQQQIYDKSISLAEIGQALEFQTGTLGRQQYWVQQALRLQAAGGLASPEIARQMMISMDIVFAKQGGIKSRQVQELATKLAPFVGAAGLGPEEVAKLFEFAGTAGIAPTERAYKDYFAKVQAGYTASKATSFGAFMEGLQKGGTTYMAMGGTLEEAISAFAAARSVMANEALAATLVEQVARLSSGAYAKPRQAIEQKLGVRWQDLSMDERMRALLQYVEAIPEATRGEVLAEQGFPVELSTQIGKMVSPEARRTMEATRDIVEKATADMIEKQTRIYMESMLAEQRKTEAGIALKRIKAAPRLADWRTRIQKARADFDLALEEGQDRWMRDSLEPSLLALEQLQKDIEKLLPTAAPETKRRLQDLQHIVEKTIRSWRDPVGRLLGFAKLREDAGYKYTRALQLIMEGQEPEWGDLTWWAESYLKHGRRRPGLIKTERETPIAKPSESPISKEAETEITARPTAKETEFEVPVEAVAERQQVGVPVEAVAEQQQVGVPVELAADIQRANVPVQERLVEQPATVVHNHYYYDYGMRFFPRAGEDESGPRIEPGAFG